MQNDLSGEQCVICGAGAAVRVAGTSFCASCGLHQYSSGGLAPGAVSLPGPRSHRAAIVGIFSSGFLLKMLMGAVALATVGGVTASLQSDPVAASSSPPPAAATVVPNLVPSTIAAVVPIDSDTEVPDAVVDPTRGSDQVAAAHEYVAAVQAWADCVSEAASTHSRGTFDPVAVCEKPSTPADFDIPGHDEDGPGASEDAPGHDEDRPGASEDAPGHDEDGPGASEDAPGHDEDDGDTDDGDAESSTDDKDKDK